MAPRPKPVYFNQALRQGQHNVRFTSTHSEPQLTAQNAVPEPLMAKCYYNKHGHKMSTTFCDILCKQMQI